MRKHSLNIAIVLIFVLLVIVPIFYTLVSSFIDDSFTENIKLISKKTFILLGKSLIVSGIISVFSTFLGTVLSIIINKTRIWFSSSFKILILLPLFISPYILAVAFKDFSFIIFGNTDLISSYFGVILVHTIIFTPLAFLITGSALENINSDLEESALMITNIRVVIFKIILPLIKPALISSFILIFIFSISEFSVPAFFNVKVFTTEIFTQFSAFYNHLFAILQSVLLILVCIILLFSERKHIANAPFFSIGNKGTNSKKYNIKGFNWANQLIVLIWIIISIILPFFVLIMQSFKDGTDSFYYAFDLLLPTFTSSILLALFGAILIVIIGFVFAYLSVQLPKSKKYFSWVLLIAFAIPSTILGISLIKFYNHSLLNFIYSSYAIILIGYIGKFSFISAKLIENSIKQIPNSLLEIAKIQGIKTRIINIRILIPLIFPAIFASFIIGFIFSLGELGTTIMLYPPGTEIMPIKVFTIMANAPQSLTSSMTLIVFSVSLLLISSFYYTFRFVKPRNK